MSDHAVTYRPPRLRKVTEGEQGYGLFTLKNARLDLGQQYEQKWRSQMTKREYLQFKHYEVAPPELFELLPELYKCYFSTAEYLDLASFPGKIGAISASLPSADEQDIRHILVLKKDRGEMQVVNELPTLSPQEADAICQEIFTLRTDIEAISFNRVPLSASLLSWPALNCYVIENDIVKLPPNYELYINNLGKTTRKHLGYYERRLAKEYPSARFFVLEKNACDMEKVVKIAEFQRTRLKSKGIPVNVDPDANNIEKIYRSCVKWGHVGIYEINGVIAAGVVFYRLDSNFYFLIISHDDNFAKFNIGQLCLLNTIRSAILAGGKMLHMGWGANEYKKRFCAESAISYNITVYRSRVAMWLSRRAWLIWAKGAARAARRNRSGLFRPPTDAERIAWQHSLRS
jgi:Acetyltransferase (GNAT) domain